MRNLSLGITGWVTFADRSPDHDANLYDFDQVGYAKSGGKWGLSIRTWSGYSEAEGSDKIEHWPFNEAPRALRVRAVAKIPALLDRLNKDAIAAAKSIAEKAGEVDQLTAAMTAIAAFETTGVTNHPLARYSKAITATEAKR